MSQINLYDYLDKYPTESLDTFISFYQSENFIVNDTAIKLASTPKVSQDILCYLLEQYCMNKNDIHILLNTTICNYKTIEALLVCIEKNKIYKSVVFNSIHHAIKIENISSFFFLTNTFFTTDLLNIVKKHIKMYTFTELYGYCLNTLQPFNIKPFLNQLLKCNIPINRNIIVWLTSDEYYEIVAECFKNKCDDIDVDTIEMVFYLLLESKTINENDSKLLVDSIPSINFIPLNIQKYINYIYMNNHIKNNFVKCLYNYYHIESLNKITMYTIVNNIYNKISKFVKSIFQYFFYQ